jgi:hypothetical protein
VDPNHNGELLVAHSGRPDHIQIETVFTDVHDISQSKWYRRGAEFLGTRGTRLETVVFVAWLLRILGQPKLIQDTISPVTKSNIPLCIPLAA